MRPTLASIVREWLLRESRMLGEFKVGAATLGGGEVPQAAGGEKGVVAVAQEEEGAA